MGTSKLANPQAGSTTTDTQVAKKQQIADLITHLGKSDNHLWQALTSLQSQTNALVNQNQMPTWTSWLPKIADLNFTPLVTTELLGYYMVSGQLLFIEIFARQLALTSVPQVSVSLPVDVGDMITKTCYAWFFNGSLATSGNGIIEVEIKNQSALLIFNPDFLNTTGRFGMGGMIGIF